MVIRATLCSFDAAAGEFCWSASSALWTMRLCSGSAATSLTVPQAKDTGSLSEILLDPYTPALRHTVSEKLPINHLAWLDPRLKMGAVGDDIIELPSPDPTADSPNPQPPFFPHSQSQSVTEDREQDASSFLMTKRPQQLPSHPNRE
ncbi:Formin-Like Protein 2 [Manis pentadactyla]|nr:Formin-Like Protein 2 [Manis pentadactyla]